VRRAVLLSLVCLSLCVWASPGGGAELQTRIPVFVSIIPQAYFLERIGGRHVEVDVLIGKGQSPHTYEPTPQQMVKLARARAFFAIGVPVEKGILRKIRQSHRNLLIVETQKGIAFRQLEHHHHHETTAGRDRDHKATAHGAPDPHIWMNPRLVKIQARNIYEALVRLDPGRQREYAANLKAFEADLDRVDDRMARSLASVKGGKIYVFHPAFGYFADAYGLQQVPIEIEGKEPSARQLSGIIEQAQKDGVRVMFVQPQFAAKSIEVVAKAIGGAVVPIDPLARDYLANLEKIAVAVEQGAVKK
jgi:zinc transport system substrate-binding protein